MSHWCIKPGGGVSVDREKFYSSNEFKNIVNKAGEIMGTKRENGRCFDGGTCGRGGFCDRCPLINNDETENFEALACASESISNLKDQLAALKEENERLKARVAELEKEDVLWSMLDAIEDGLRRNSAPCAWEAIVTSAGMSFITSRRKEPDNEG